MPAGYTHYCFGKDVYKHLDDQNIKDLLLRNENWFFNWSSWSRYFLL